MLDHRRDVARIVLQIAVGGDDEASARVCEAGGKRRGLAEVAAEADDAQVRIARPAAVARIVEALVRAAVVDDDDFVASGPTRPASR